MTATEKLTVLAGLKGRKTALTQGHNLTPKSGGDRGWGHMVCAWSASL